MKIAFDVGGVLSKYPKFVDLLLGLYFAESDCNSNVQVHVISDMHPQEKIQKMLRLNYICLPDDRVHSADYETYGEECKDILCKELGIDILIDDFVGYVASGEHIRLLVMPNAKMDYYHEDWKTDGTEGNFGRRKKK